MINKLYRDLKILGPRMLLANLFHEIKMIVKRILYSSYSQNGEDIVIDTLLNNKKSGFYVDVGAFDPFRFNNTNRFYNKDWQGINIEPDPEKIKKFQFSRVRDVNLNIGISNNAGELTYYKFEPNTLSTFSKKSFNTNIGQGYKQTDSLTIKVDTLESVLSKYCQEKTIDFLSVDTEGLDLEVLKSNNWKKFIPRVICVEAENGVGKFLNNLGYKKVKQTPTNSIYLYNT